NDSGLEPIRQQAQQNVSGKVAVYLGSAQNPSILELQQVILCGMREQIFDKIKSGNIVISTSARETLARTVQDLLNAEIEQNKASNLFKDELERLGNRALATFVYTNQRVAMGSDYSVFGLLYERKTFSPMKVVANVGLSVYHHPDQNLNQQSVRDFVLAFSL